MTGDDVFAESLLLLGVIYPGQTISPEAHATALLGINMMLGEWNAQGLAVFSIVRANYNLVNGTADYTLGSGGSLVSTRPEKIEAWAVHGTAGSTGGKPIDAAAFAMRRAEIDAQALELGLLSSASLTAQRVQIMQYDGAYPLATLHLYPIPGASLTIDLWTWEQLSVITDTTQTLDFPQGYLKAIVYSLAVDLASKFGRQVDPGVLAIADQSKQTLGGTNVSEYTRRDPGLPPPVPPQQVQGR